MNRRNKNKNKKTQIKMFVYSAQLHSTQLHTRFFFLTYIEKAKYLYTNDMLQSDVTLHHSTIYYMNHIKYVRILFQDYSLLWNKEPSCTFATTNRWQNVHRFRMHWIRFSSFQFNFKMLLFFAILANGTHRICILVSNECNLCEKNILLILHTFIFDNLNEW